MTTVLAVLLFSALCHAQNPGEKQFQRQFSLGGKLPVAILLVGYTKDAADVEKLFDVVSAKAGEAFSRLDWQNPSSEVAKLVSSSGQGPVKVSDETIVAFETARKISDWTGGAFDITYAGEGNYRDIKVNSGASTVELKKPGMQVRFDRMQDGFFAEMLSRFILAGGMQNAIVKVGSAFRGMGHGLMGPWQITIEDDAGTFARHAVDLAVANTGVATVSAGRYRSESLIDPRSKVTIRPPCRGVVIAMTDAALAGGIASAIFVLGPDAGMKLLQKFGRGLIVDNEGKFLRSPGF